MRWGRTIHIRDRQQGVRRHVKGGRANAWQHVPLDRGYLFRRDQCSRGAAGRSRCLGHGDQARTDSAVQRSGFGRGCGGACLSRLLRRRQQGWRNQRPAGQADRARRWLHSAENRRGHSTPGRGRQRPDDVRIRGHAHERGGAKIPQREKGATTVHHHGGESLQGSQVVSLDHGVHAGLRGGRPGDGALRARSRRLTQNRGAVPE